MAIRYLLAILLLFITAHAATAAGVAFSADITVTENNQTDSGKVYVDSGKMRTEMGNKVNIYRMDRRSGVALLTGSKAYMNSGIRVSDAAEIDLFNGTAQLKPSGSETINGQTCDKSDQTYMGRPCGTVWMTKAGVPVRYVSSLTHKQIDYSNVKVGAQPESLFNPPADYKKIGL